MNQHVGATILLAIGFAASAPAARQSPGCNAIAIGGDTSYKYVWLVRRHQRATYYKTGATPWTVRFSLSGDVLAVSTGSSRGALLSLDGAVHYSELIGLLPHPAGFVIGVRDTIEARAFDGKHVAHVAVAAKSSFVQSLDRRRVLAFVKGEPAATVYRIQG